jgi:hypothetical protein
LDNLQSLWNCYHNEGDTSLRCIVTGDETWIHHYAPENKRQSMEWKHLTSPVKSNKNLTISRKCDVYTFLGCTRASSGTLQRDRHNSKQCPLQHCASEPVETSCLNQTRRTVVARCRNVAR